MATLNIIFPNEQKMKPKDLTQSPIPNVRLINLNLNLLNNC